MPQPVASADGARRFISPFLVPPHGIGDSYLGLLGATPSIRLCIVGDGYRHTAIRRVEKFQHLMDDDADFPAWRSSQGSLQDASIE